MRLKRNCSALIALLLILAGCVLRFAMPGHDYLGYLLWGIAAETTLPSMRVNYFIREAVAAAYMQLAGTLY